MEKKYSGRESCLLMKHRLLIQGTVLMPVKWNSDLQSEDLLVHAAFYGISFDSETFPQGEFPFDCH